ncbi:hypothetical protein [Mucilaginibacter glaciei]|uniref:Uncharacterized protein n=1 Tax=Mucilaginibacter glaciei TaxID=2772109 RepID=A0A926NMR7_9SPHI|nr:hypothetical protein [Mucilaginibacter glaciei]MBD1394949.1 hypothetical protein [Mucilaginibacter glaciei]
MNKLSFDVAGLTPVDIDAFDATCNHLRENYRVEVPGDIDFQLEQFETFNHYKDLNIRDTYAIKHIGADSYMLFLEMNPNAKSTRAELKHHHNYQPWALTYLKQDFGRVFIRTETLLDKIREIVFPIELDFREDKPFSDRFYVLTDDKEKAHKAMTQQFRDAMMLIKETDFVVEIFEHTLIIGNRKPVAPEHACYLAEFVSRLANLS